MNNAKLSVQVWGGYLAVVGVGLFLIPNVILTTLGFAATSEPWVRVLGALSMILGYFFLRLSAADIRAFYPWTIHARVAFPILLAALVVFNLAPPNLLLFGAFDLLGALWTFLALRSE